MALSSMSESQEATVGAMLHKSEADACAMPNDVEVDEQDGRKWYIAIVPQRRNMSYCRTYFTKAGFKAYIAGKKKQTKYSNRSKYESFQIIIYGVVFVRTTYKDLDGLWKGCPYIRTFLYDRAKSSDVQTGHRPFATIPQHEMARLQEAVDKVLSLDDIEFTTEQLTTDSKIKVVNGNLKGMYGNYYRDMKGDFLVFSVGDLGNIKVKVQIKDCKLDASS